MAGRNLDLALRVRADLAQASRGVRRLGREVRDLGAEGRRAGRLLGRIGAAARGAAGAYVGFHALSAAIRGAARGISAVVSATRAQQDAVAQVARGLRNLGTETTLTSGGLQAMASWLQRVTTYGDETTLAMQSLLLSFRGIDDSNFDRVTVAALDMATALGTAPRDAALQLAKALEDPVRGLTALRRAGTVFSASQTETIRRLHETGRAAEAQRQILAEVERQYGGAARTARDTLGGALAGVTGAWGDALEASAEAGGGADEFRRALGDLEGVLTSGDFRSAMADVTDAALRVGAAFVDAAAGVASFLAGAAAPTPPPTGIVREIEAAEAAIRRIDARVFHVRRNQARRPLTPGEVKRLNYADREIGKLRARIEALTTGRDRLARQIFAGGAPSLPTPAALAGTPGAAVDRKAAERAGEEALRIQRAAEDELARLTLSRSELITREEERRLAAVRRRLDAGELDERRAAAAIAAIRAVATAKRRDALEEEIDAERAATAARIEAREEEADAERAAGEAYARAAAAAAARIEAARRASLGSVGRGLEDYATAALDTADEIEAATEDAFRGMEAALVRFVRTGKLSFASLADSIIADLARIAVRQAIVGPLARGLLGALGGPTGLGGPYGPLTPYNTAGPDGVVGSVLHSGGIAGAAGGTTRRVSSVPFAAAPRLHAGGIASRLAPGEVPAILRAGEGVFTPEQMRALGAGGPREVRVEIVNAGAPQRVVEARAQPDLRGLVIAIATDDLASGGALARAVARVPRADGPF